MFFLRLLLRLSFLAVDRLGQILSNFYFEIYSFDAGTLLIILYWSARWMMERGERCYVDKDQWLGDCTEGHSSLKTEEICTEGH